MNPEFLFWDDRTPTRTEPPAASRDRLRRPGPRASLILTTVPTGSASARGVLHESFVQYIIMVEKCHFERSTSGIREQAITTRSQAIPALIGLW